MTKRISAKYKVSRRLGVNLWGRDNDPFLTKNYGPGEHGPTSVGKRPTSDYGVQLKAKQKLRFYYGNIGEKQFYNIYELASKTKGDTSENLISLLERRLDAVIYRAGIVPTVFAARQIVNHNHLLVNGKKVNIPSYRLKVGDVVEVKEKAKSIPIIREMLDDTAFSVPNYLDVDRRKATVTLVANPILSDVPYPTQMEPNLVVEFYSK